VKVSLYQTERLSMRSTVRIDDDLLQTLKARAEREGTSLTRTLNAVLRTGLVAANSGEPVSTWTGH